MWKKVFLAVSLTVGIGLFIFFIQKFGGFGKALEAVASVGWSGVVSFVFLCAGTMLYPGMGWWILMRSEKMKVSLWSTLKANFMGFPVNFIAPSMYLGAEPLKIYYVAQVSSEPKRKILATIVVSKFQEMGALLFTMVLAAGIAVWKIDFPRQQEIMVLGALTLLVSLFLLAVYGFVSNRQPTVKAINALARLAPRKRPFSKWRRKLARLRTRAEEMEHLIHTAFTKKWKTFLVAQAVTTFSALSVLVRPWVYFYFAHGEWIPFEKLSAIYIVTNLINMLPHTPGALGVMEGGMLGLFRILGLGTDSDAAAYQVVGRVSDIILILLGAWLIFHYNLQSMARRIAQGKEKVGVHEADVDEDGATSTSA